jgi:DNA polymerase III subunit alpha
MDYLHPHIHSEYSLLDGAIRIKELVKLTKQYGMSAMSITDHGSLAGTLEFYREARKEGIKSVLGIETYITMDKDGLSNEEKTRDNMHMILLAANEEGWKNLLWLNSNAYQNNFYYKPRISFDNLISRSHGIIASSACLAGVCARQATYDEINNIYSDPEHKVEKVINQFKEIFFGKYYLELMHSSQKQQISYNKFLIELGARTNTKLIISADAHYEKKEDEELHSMLMAMQSKKSIDQYKNEDYFHYEGCYIRPPQEMLDAAISIGVESAFHNTLEIASLVNLDIKLGEYKMPIFDITTDYEYDQFCQENQ